MNEIEQSLTEMDEFAANGWPNGDPCGPIELAQSRARERGEAWTPPVPTTHSAENAPTPENAAFAAEPQE